MKIKYFNESIDTQEHIDYILDKINKIGYDKLSNHDKKLLDKYKDGSDEIKKIITQKEKEIKSPNKVTKDLGFSIENDDLAINIGRYVRLTDKVNTGLLGKYGIIYEIVGLQRMWGRNKEGKYVPNIEGYRLSQVGKKNDFGRPGDPSELKFIDNMTEKEVLDYNEKVMIRIRKELKL